MAEECGHLTEVCKALSQSRILSQRFPTPQEFLSVVAGLSESKPWPSKMIGIQGYICYAGDIHIIGLCLDRKVFDVECCEIGYIFATFKGNSHLKLPLIKDIGTKSLSYVRDCVITEVERLLKMEPCSIPSVFPSCLGTGRVITCIQKRQPCLNAYHDAQCDKWFY